MGSSNEIRRTRQEQAEEVRHRVLDAAARLFVERGVANTSMEDLALEAGYSRGAVYSRYRHRDDVLRALLERTVDRKSVAVAAFDTDPQRQADATRGWADAAAAETPATRVLLVEFWLLAQRDLDARRLLRAYERLRIDVGARTAARLDRNDDAARNARVAAARIALNYGLTYLRALDPKLPIAEIQADVARALRTM